MGLQMGETWRELSTDMWRQKPAQHSRALASSKHARELGSPLLACTQPQTCVKGCNCVNWALVRSLRNPCLAAAAFQTSGAPSAVGATLGVCSGGTQDGGMRQCSITALPARRLTCEITEVGFMELSSSHYNKHSRRGWSHAVTTEGPQACPSHWQLPYPVRCFSPRQLLAQLVGKAARASPACSLPNNSSSTLRMCSAHCPATHWLQLRCSEGQGDATQRQRQKLSRVARLCRAAERPRVQPSEMGLTWSK
jgi:hypothetical protein